MYCAFDQEIISNNLSFLTYRDHPQVTKRIEVVDGVEQGCYVITDDDNNRYAQYTFWGVPVGYGDRYDDFTYMGTKDDDECIRWAYKLAMGLAMDAARVAN